MAKPPTERRKDRRQELACPVFLVDDSGGKPLKSRTVNLSDGGAYLTMPAHEAPPPGRQVAVVLRVPRRTPNTYMLEEFCAQAVVVRQDERREDACIGIALRFLQRLDLTLEVF